MLLRCCLFSVIFFPIVITDLKTCKWIDSELNSQNHFFIFFTFITHLYNNYCSKNCSFLSDTLPWEYRNAWNVIFKKFRLLLNDTGTVSAWGCCLACAKFLAIFSLVKYHWELLQVSLSMYMQVTRVQRVGTPQTSQVS